MPTIRAEMQRPIQLIAAVIAGALTMSGCSSSRVHEDHSWRRPTEAACIAKSGYGRDTAFIRRVDRVRGQGACGVWHPLRVSAALHGSVDYSSAVTINCPMTSAVDAWFWHFVQPAAINYFGSPVVGVRTMGGYVCRNRNHRSGGKLSEHSFGNAIDFGAFTLANGREITVLRGWRGAPDEGMFLRDIHRGACRIFTTVIGPDGDRHHQDHFHFDLARHNRDNSYRYCR